MVQSHSQNRLQSSELLACSRCFTFFLFFFLIPQRFCSQGEEFGGGRAGGKLQSGTVACRFPG